MKLKPVPHDGRHYRSRVVETSTDVKIVSVIAGGLGPQRPALFVTLLEVGVLIIQCKECVTPCL